MLVREVLAKACWPRSGSRQLPSGSGLRAGRANIQIRPQRCRSGATTPKGWSRAHGAQTEARPESRSLVKIASLNAPGSRLGPAGGGAVVAGSQPGPGPGSAAACAGAATLKPVGWLPNRSAQRGARPRYATETGPPAGAGQGGPLLTAGRGRGLRGGLQPGPWHPRVTPQGSGLPTTTRGALAGQRQALPLSQQPPGALARNPAHTSPFPAGHRSATNTHLVARVTRRAPCTWHFRAQRTARPPPSTHQAPRGQGGPLRCVRPGRPRRWARRGRSNPDQTATALGHDSPSEGTPPGGNARTKHTPARPRAGRAGGETACQAHGTPQGRQALQPDARSRGPPRRARHRD